MLAPRVAFYAKMDNHEPQPASTILAARELVYQLNVGY